MFPSGSPPAALVFVPKSASVTSISRHIPQDQQRLLWVRAGGRCELCNRYLLEDPSTRSRSTSANWPTTWATSRALVAAWAETRWTGERRNDADNLLLLCGTCHPSIDAKLNSGTFTVEYLREQKKLHEDRIRYLTGLGEDAETVVLRVIGDIRGAAVELSEQIAARAVLAAGRRYPRSAGAISEGFRARSATARVGELRRSTGRPGVSASSSSLARLRDAVARGQVRHLSVLCLAPDPAARVCRRATGRQGAGRAVPEATRRRRGLGLGSGS